MNISKVKWWSSALFHHHNRITYAEKFIRVPFFHFSGKENKPWVWRRLLQFWSEEKTAKIIAIKICKQAKTLKKIVGERSELRLHTEWTKIHKRCHKWLIWRVYEKQSVLPDRSLIIGQKLIENAKIENFRWFLRNVH